jgi:hypothetical protein
VLAAPNLKIDAVQHDRITPRHMHISEFCKGSARFVCAGHSC